MVRLENKARTGAAARALRAASRRIVDFREPFRAVANVISEEMAATVRRRGLVASGRLLALVGSPQSAIRTLTARELRVGPNQRYQFVQHYGSVKRKIEPQPYIEWTPRGESELDRLLRGHVARVTSEVQREIDSLGVRS